MLQIEPDQLESIERASLAERVVEVLYASFPQETGPLDVDELVRQALQQVNRAQSYGLSEGTHVFRFVLAAWIFGPAFDERIGTLHTVLQDATTTPAARAERLERAVLDTLAALSHDTEVQSDGVAE